MYREARNACNHCRVDRPGLESQEDVHARRKGDLEMPLPMKTLQEAALELGMAETEIRTMVDLKKIRAVLKKGKMTFAPDEIAKIRRLRKTVPESAQKSSAVLQTTPKPLTPAPARPALPRRPPPSRRFGP
jgi:hypothetical protein